MPRATIPTQQNLFLRSQEFDNASWTKNSCTVTANSTTAPDGTLTADTLDGSAGAVQLSRNIAATTSVGVVYTSSIYAKANSTNFLQIAHVVTFGVQVYANFDLLTGTVGTTGTLTTATITSVGNGWYRCSMSGAVTTLGAPNASFVPVESASAARLPTNSGTTSIYIWGAQLTQANWPGPYIVTTSAAVNNGNLRNLTPTQQNLCLQSQTFNSATWGKTACTVTADTATAPDGTLTADTLDGSAGASALTQSLSGVVPNNSYTLSVYAKANSTNFLQLAFGNTAFGASIYANFDLANGVLGTVGSGATATITSAGNGWYRCRVTQPATIAFGTGGWFIIPAESASAARVPTNVGATSIFVWGAGLTRANQPGPYIVTTTTAVNTGDLRNLTPTQQNLLLQSQTFDNASWTKVGSSTVTANSTTAPDGTSTADTLNGVAGASYLSQAFGGTFSNGVTATMSVYAKAASTNYLQIVAGVAFGSLAYANFDLLNGVLGTMGSNTTARIESVGSGWYRCSITSITTSVGTVSANYFGTESASQARLAVNAGAASIYLWGANVNQSNYPAPYIATTTPVYNVGTPRNFTPTRQNLILQSQTFDNASWSKTNTTITADTTTAPDGTLTADTMTDTVDGAPAQHLIQQGTTGGLIGVTQTFSAYIKAGTKGFAAIRINSQNIQVGFNLSTGATQLIAGSPISYSATLDQNGFYRCSVTYLTVITTTTPLIYICNVISSISYQGDGTGTIIVWGANLNQSNSPLPYIATTTVAVNTGTPRNIIS